MVFKIISLGLMAIFYFFYFAKMVSQKKRGIHTDQLGKGKEGFLKFIEVTLKITTYILPIIQIASILYCFENAPLPMQITGVIVELFGIIAFVASVAEMKDNWRAGVQRESKTSLVTTGIYSISRNPAFLGFDMMYIGILCAFFNWYLMLATAFAIVFFHLQIVKVEENFLEETFGEEYFKYKKKACRYIGRKYWS